MEQEKLRIGVIFGGLSTEKEVSLSSGRYVSMNISPLKYQCIPIYMDLESRFWKIPQKLVVKNTTVDIERRLEKDAERIPYEKLKEIIDFAFIALHGKFGEDGCVQGLLELLRIPYSCSGVRASSLGMDKAVLSSVLNQGGCRVPKMMAISKNEWTKSQKTVEQRIADTIGFPLVTKPSREGSSVGITRVKEEKKLIDGIEAAFQYDNVMICEEFLDGMEFSCGVMGNDYDNLIPMPPTETCYDSEYYTYEDKYMPGKSKKITPARVSDEILEKIQEEVMKAYRLLGFKGFARIDGFVVGEEIYITDPNSLPGMAPSSFIFHQAAEMGLTASQFVDRVIELGLQAHKEKIGPL